MERWVRYGTSGACRGVFSGRDQNFRFGKQDTNWSELGLGKIKWEWGNEYHEFTKRDDWQNLGIRRTIDLCCRNAKTINFTLSKWEPRTVLPSLSVVMPASFFCGMHISPSLSAFKCSQGRDCAEKRQEEEQML